MAHHPDFVRFHTAFQQGRFDEALRLVDGLIVHYADEPWLRWHRATCLERLARYDAMLPELEIVLALNPDFVPAIVKRVQYASLVDAGSASLEPERATDPAARRAEDEAARARLASRQAEAELRRALAIAPADVEVLSMLSALLRRRDDETQWREAEALLERAIERAPTRIDLRETRATRRRDAALLDQGVAGDPADTIESFAGLRHSRRLLEGALDDYAHCHAQDGEARHALHMGMVLHDLGRHAEALARYDLALAAMPDDDPAREFVVATRARSENQGAGEREQLAQLLEHVAVEETVPTPQDVPPPQDESAARAILAAAPAVRARRSVQQALESRLLDDPDTPFAATIAQQLLAPAREPPPGLEAVAAADYADWQLRQAVKFAREAEALGLRHVVDVEARGLSSLLGEHVLIRCYADDGGETGVTAFARKPRWPGWTGFLQQLLRGRWTQSAMVECTTVFEDGTLLSTQTFDDFPFEFGGRARIEYLRRGASVTALVERHLERVDAHRQAFPLAGALIAADIGGIERRWREAQRIRRAYRDSIGHATDGELRRLLGPRYERCADKVRAQLASLSDEPE